MAPEDEQKRMGKYMLIGMWILLVALLTMMFGNILQRQYNPNTQLATEPGVSREVSLKRNKYGHYVATGMINGEPVIFMIDTGASDIAVPARVADKLGLERGQKVVYQTAKGPATAYATIITQVSLGDIQLHNVRASINPYMKNEEILLGMSFLKQLEFSQRGNVLTLRQY